MPEPCRPRRPAGRRSSAALAALVPAFALAAAAFAPPALAQYKWVSADGTVTYGDRPPPGARPLGQPGGDAQARSAPQAAGSPALPYELRTTAERHPVVIYVSADCPPCEQARAHLAKRGIPHLAREVRTQRDAEAFSALGFSSLSFPAVSIGRERLVGFEPTGWDRMLDAAGYPKESKLPRGWQAARAEPLTRPEPAVVTLQADAAAEPAAGEAEAITAAPASPERRRPARSTAAIADPAPTIRF